MLVENMSFTYELVLASKSSGNKTTSQLTQFILYHRFDRGGHGTESPKKLVDFFSVFLAIAFLDYPLSLETYNKMTDRVRERRLDHKKIIKGRLLRTSFILS